MRRRRPLLPRLHRWVGVGLAAWLVLVAVTGALLLWSDAWLRFRLPVAADTATPAWPAPETIATLLDAAPGPVSRLGLPRPGAPWGHVYLVDGGEWLLDPASGARLAEHVPSASLTAFLFDLHAHLLAGDTGRTVVGILGLLLTGTIVAGLALWLRRRRAFDLRRVMIANVTPQDVLRSHVAQGALASGLLLAVALTGLSLVFPGSAAALLDGVLGREAPTRPSVTQRVGPAGPPDWALVLATGREAFPEARLRFLTPPADPGGVAVLRLRTPEELHPDGRSYAVVDPATGALLERIDARERGAGPAVVDALYPIHAGATGWPGHRWIQLLTAIVLLRLVITSLWLQTDRRARRARLAQLARSAPVGRSASSACAKRQARQHRR